MAIAVFPRTGLGSQSQRPLRRGHWSTHGLTCLVSGFPETTGIAPVDHVTRRPLRESFLTLPKARSGALVFDNVSDGHVYIPDAFQTTTESATVLLIRRKHDAVNRDSNMFGWSSGGSNQIGVTLPYQDGVIYFDWGGQASPNRLSVAGLNMAGIQKWAFTAGRRGSGIYLDGILKASQSTAITHGNTNASGARLGRGAGAGDFQDLYFFAVLNVEWTPTQIAEWTVNPWLMFEPIASPMVEGEAAPIIGSAVFGVTTTVTATRAIAFGLDNNTNIHDEAGKFKVFGDADVTGDVSVAGDLTVAGSVTLSRLGGPFIGTQTPGSFTITTGQYGLHGKRLTLTTTQRATLQGTGRLVISG